MRERVWRWLTRAPEELRDPWALALAAAGAFAAYLVGGRDWQILAVLVAVLVVRVVAGLLMPLPPILPPPALTSDEETVARFIVQGVSNAQIAEQMRTTEKAVDRLEARILAKKGGMREDLGRWVGAPGTPELLPRHWYERTVVRGTLAGGALISLVWTLYNISRCVFVIHC